MEQQQQKDLKQSLRVQSTETKEIQETRQYGGQDNGKMELNIQKHRTCLEKEGEKGRKNTITIQSNRKRKRKGKRRW